jgi:ABC-type multidrug transport system ATPase subunit
MIVGPAKAFFMDEISNGLDSSTTFRIIKCFQQLANINECTMLISLLQPTPEVFDLFDDLILMAEGKIIYHGPRNEAHNFFEDCGFRCPKRKGMADFLQEVTNINHKKDAKAKQHNPEAHDLFFLILESLGIVQKGSTTVLVWYR